MKITITSGPARTKPAIGDRRMTKKHGLQIRVPETHNDMWVRSNWRQCYVWRSPEDLRGTQFAYLLTPSERGPERYECGYMQQRGAA